VNCIQTPTTTHTQVGYNNQYGNNQQGQYGNNQQGQYGNNGYNNQYGNNQQRGGIGSGAVMAGAGAGLFGGWALSNMFGMSL